jgi:hypothetical protein
MRGAVTAEANHVLRRTEPLDPKADGLFPATGAGVPTKKCGSAERNGSDGDYG